MINEPLLFAVLMDATIHPENHDQSFWARKSACGTTGCVAGNAVIMMNHKLDWIRICDNTFEATHIADTGSRGEIASQAMADLGLNSIQAEYLFDAPNSLSDLWDYAARFTDGRVRCPDNLIDKVEELSRHGRNE